MGLLLAVLFIFIILVVAEVWWRGLRAHGEFSRKFVHITVGTFVAFWPFFLSWAEIEILSIAFLAVVVISRQLKLFQAIHSVQRPTWGELFFALAVGLVALVTHDKWIYAAALLQMSLADGLAAVVGVRYGARHSYNVFGHRKSLIGSLTFFTVSLLILLTLNHWTDHTVSLGLAAGIALLASVLENVAVRGLDNVLVPLAVVLLITR